MESRLPENVAVTEREATKLESPVRLGRMYQNLGNSVESLRGVPTRWFDAATAGSIVNELAAREAVYEAYRAYWAGRALVEAKEFGKASVVLEAAAGKQEAAVAATTQAPELDAGVVTAAEELMQRIRSMRAYMVACAALAEEEPAAEEAAAGRGILETPKIFPQTVSEAVVAEFPPAFTPIPCQPLFFDLASTYLSFPDLSSKTGQSTAATSAPAAAAASSSGGQAEEAPKKTGWFGLW